MRTLLHSAKLILPDEIVTGWLLAEDNRISQVGRGEPPADLQADVVRSLAGNYLAPGLIDSHVHGGNLGNFSHDGTEGIVKAAKTHLAGGITTIYPTVVPGDHAAILAVIDRFRGAREAMEDGPNMPGLHLEGPYLNVKQRGAISEKNIRPPRPDEYRDILRYAKGDVRRWTFAPEMEGAAQFAEDLREAGVLPSIGHSDAEYSTVLEIFRHGATHVTHLYSACSTIVRRSGFRFPGVIESAYAIPDMTVEIIADGCHLPPELLRMVWRLKGVSHTCLVTDALQYAGAGLERPGETVHVSDPHDRSLIIEDDVLKVADRSVFSGSIATADRLLRVMRDKAQVPLVDCVRMMSLTPAQILGIDDKKGSLTVRKDADLIVFDEDIKILGVMVGGKGVLGCLK